MQKNLKSLNMAIFISWSSFMAKWFLIQKTEILKFHNFWSFCDP